MASKDSVAELLRLVKRISTLNIPELVSNSDWGTVNFLSCANELRDVVTMVKPLESLSTRLIPDQPMKQIISTLTNFEKLVERIEEFKLEGDAASKRDTIVNEAKSHANTVYSSISPHAAYLALQAGDLDQTIQALETLRIKTTKEIDAFTQGLESSKQEIESIMMSAREAAGEAGVGAFSADFSQTAGEQDTEARLWLKVSGVFGALSIVAGVGSYFMPIAADATNVEIIQLVTSKFVVLGLLLSATFWSSRQFRALRHQIAVNNHRANALKTFQAFSNAASDGPTKDAVLLETTRSIFSISPSGYLGSQGDPSTQDGLKIVELFRGGTQT